jgi:hypothetical protein
MRSTTPVVLGLGVVAAWLSSNLVAATHGIHFDDSGLPWTWHFLDVEVLRTDLLRGVYHLHSQPPLFNLFLGAILQLFPASAHAAFAAIYQVMSLALLCSVAWLMTELGVSAGVAVAACLLFGLAPTFIAYGHWLHYTFPAALLLCVSAASLAAFVRTERVAWAHAFSWFAAAVMLMRAIYHPVWFVIALAMVAATLRPGIRRRLVAAAIAPLLVVNLWYAKNYVEVGSYTASSWLGMHLRRGWVPTPDEAAILRANGVPPVWNRLPFLEATHYRDLGYFVPPADGAGVDPAIDAPFKQNGEPNYNHRDYARIARAMLAGDLIAMRTFPAFYARRVAAGLSIFLQPGPVSLPNKIDRAQIMELAALPNRLFLCGVFGRGDSPNLFFLVFAAAVVFGGLRVWRSPPDFTVRPVLAYVTVTVLWATAAVNLLEMGENDRLRFEIDPLVLVLLGCAITWVAGMWRTAVDRPQPMTVKVYHVRVPGTEHTPEEIAGSASSESASGDQV